ncbi:MAG TPA: hypothetical protein VM345_15655 [Acidimicrobiales bacterium]|nr:hypothetical protein [Acidimicrobiales bacterium]
MDARTPRSLTAAVAGVLAVLLVLGAADATSGAQRAQNQQDDPGAALTAVNTLLDERERAFAAGDANAWMATVDPHAPQEFKDAQARHFNGLRSLPVERFSLVARLDDTGDLAPEPDRFLPETRMSYRFTGFDDRDAVDTLWLTFVLRDGRWFVGADADVGDLGLDTARGLWDVGDVRALRTPHFLILHHPSRAARAEALAAIAEEALETLRKGWDQRWSERIPIVLPRNVEELETLLQSTIDLDKFVAFVSYGAVRDEGWTSTAPRMFIQDDNLGSYGRGFQVETLVHELVHAAGAPLAGPFLAAWVHEGVADWVATGRSTGERKPSGSDGVLPRDYEFSTGSQADIIRAYRESRSAVSFLASRHGMGAPTSFFVAGGEPKVAPGSVDHRLDAALRAAAKVSVTDLQKGWAAR